MKPIWIISALALSGFIFPPLWIALVIYLIWVAFFRRRVRERVINQYIEESVARNETLFLIPVPYRDARMYALQNGGRLTRQEVTGAECAVMNLALAGRQRMVTFNEGHRPAGTWVRFVSN